MKNTVKESSITLRTQEASEFAHTPDVGALPLLIDVDVCEAMGAGTARQVRRWCAEGKIKAVKIGRKWFVNRDAFLEKFGLA